MNCCRGTSPRSRLGWISETLPEGDYTPARTCFQAGLTGRLPNDKGKVARYRERLRASGAKEVLLQLPREMIAMLDELKERQGLRNRSLALMQLIERGREATQ
jgi:hypothetical protein